MAKQQTIPPPPKGHSWCNASGVTAEQLEPDKGWRFTTLAEFGQYVKGQGWNGTGWGRTAVVMGTNINPAEGWVTVRTQQPPPAPIEWRIDPFIKEVIESGAKNAVDHIRAHYNVYPETPEDAGNLMAWLTKLAPPVGGFPPDYVPGAPVSLAPPSAAPLVLEVRATETRISRQTVEETISGRGHISIDRDDLQSLFDEHDGDLDDMLSALLSTENEECNVSCTREEGDEEITDSEVTDTQNYEVTFPSFSCAKDLLRAALRTHQIE